jgi:formate hydrogenlyase subunit 3/multisubunit Na+/H+ antiporter MnhD subunit
VVAATGRSAVATSIVYGVSLAASTVAGVTALVQLIDNSDPAQVTLPLGLPWLGAHFRIGALAAFFLFVVNLGAGAASLFALGYSRHEHALIRVLPFYPAFLVGMNLVGAGRRRLHLPAVVGW